MARSARRLVRAGRTNVPYETIHEIGFVLEC